MNRTLTPEQQKLVEDNHNLIYSILRKMNLSDDDFYGIAAIGLCKAAMSYKDMFMHIGGVRMANISERIKELREEARLSQDELAQKVNMSRISIGNYERGIRTPDAANIIRIATFFKVSTDYLLGLSDTKSIDINVRATCDYTGLSEKAVSYLHKELTGERRKEPPHEKYSVPLLQQFINTLLEGADWVRA